MVSNKKYSLLKCSHDLLSEATKMLISTIRDKLSEEGSTINIVTFEAILDTTINELTSKE